MRGLLRRGGGTLLDANVPRLHFLQHLHVDSSSLWPIARKGSGVREPYAVGDGVEIVTPECDPSRARVTGEGRVRSTLHHARVRLREGHSLLQNSIAGHYPGAMERLHTVASFTAVLAVLLACKGFKNDDPPPAASASSSAAPMAADTAKTKPALAPAPTLPLVLKLSDQDVPLPVGLVFVREGGVLQIVLANQPVSCQDFDGKFGTDDKRISLSVNMPPGPGQTYFAGHRVGVTGQISAPGVTADYINQNQLVAQLETTDAKAGSHVKGWVVWERGALGAKGTFDAKICPIGSTSAVPPLGAEATAGAVSGTAGGESFTAKKVLAVVRHEKDTNVEYVSELDFFGGDDVTCEDTPATDTHNPSLALTNMGGASAKNDFSGTVQPVDGMFAPTAWKVGKSRLTGGGWIQLEALDFDAPLKGTVQVALLKGGTVGGAFTAEVCRKK